MGLVRQTPLLILPQASLDSITADQGIDSVYEYSLSNWVRPQEDGTYDFSEFDRVLGASRGLRVELGMHNIPLARWAETSSLGEPVKRGESGVSHGGLSFKYGGFRIKAADGAWDGFFVRNGNDNSFTPACLAVWSETLFRYACDFYRAVAKHCRGNPSILRYTLNSEGSVVYVSEMGLLWDAALPYYRDHLRRRFGDIRALNRVFGTAHERFDDIPLPRPPGEGEKTVRLTPAYYEYTQMCIDRTKRVREQFARVLKEADPDHVVGEVQSSMFGGNTYDTYAMAVNTPYDTFAAGDSDTRSIRYQYSLNRYHPKPIWLYEPYTYNPWRTPEGKGYRVEETARRMLTANVWRWFIWGHQGLPFFNQRNNSEITDYRIADIMLRPSSCNWQPQPVNPVVRPAAASLAVLKPVYEKLARILWSAPVVGPRIGLLESSSTHRVPWPTSGTFSDVGLLQGRLERERKHFFFVPETALVEGAEPMDSYRVIIAAYATHLRPEARDRLLEWVQKGGVLIGSGPTGLFDHYGRSAGGIPESVFGMTGLEYGAGLTEESKVATCRGTMAGREGLSLWSNRDFYWRLPSQGLKEGTRVLAALADGTPVAVARDYGAGKVILTAATIGALADLYWPMVQAEINRAQPVPEAASSSPELTLQVRENPDGIRYLSIVNLNISAPTEATLTVAGEFEHPRDLTVGEGWVIPAEAGGGVTRFRIWLAPGAGTFVELGKSTAKLSGLTPAEESAVLAMGRYTNLLHRAAAWGLDTAADGQALKAVEAAGAAGRYEQVRTRVAAMGAALHKRWFDSRTAMVKAGSRDVQVDPVAAAWAESYAAMAQALLQQGKADAAEERMAQAEGVLALTPEVFAAGEVFPFVSRRLALDDVSSWPKHGWRTVYSDRKARRGELGEFVLVASAEGLYVGARVRADKVTDTAQRPGLAWRVMDGVVLHLRCLDRTRELPGEFRSEDTYEITFYADGSVFVWDNLLPCDAKLIRNQVTRVQGGYCVAGFIPGAAVRFWPRPGVNVIVDVCLYTYGTHEAGYWHGKYGQASTWARVRLGDALPTAAASRAGVTEAGLPPGTAEACLRVEHWMPQEAMGVGTALASSNAAEVLPAGKKGAIILSNPGRTESVQLMTRFAALGRKPGLRIWLMGGGTGAQIELRITGREGYTWQSMLKDDTEGWRMVDVALDECRQVYEDDHSELMGGFIHYRPRLNSLIVRFTKPLMSVKVGLVQYLEE